MRRLLGLLRGETVSDAVAEDGARQAERALRGLIVASVVLPVLIFTGVATIAYWQYFESARERLLLRLGHVYQHAVTVFETFDSEDEALRSYNRG